MIARNSDSLLVLALIAARAGNTGPRALNGDSRQ